MSLLQPFIDHVKKEKLFTTSDHLLVAVSGGLDSVVLCQLCKEAGFAFSIAHCHFGLRGGESDRDAAFVKDLAQKLDASFYFRQFDTTLYASENKLSIQVAARALRYEWFSALIKENNELKWLLTAHHADDAVETALMQFCKGTGIEGLKGIPEKRSFIIRPLLFAGKAQIKAYALEKGLNWVEDSSNDETKYTRNYFRHTVLPTIEKVMPHVRNNLMDTTTRLKEASFLYAEAIDLHKKKLLEVKGNEVHIPVLKLAKTTPLNTIIFEIIKEYNFFPTQVGEVVKLLTADSGKYIKSATHRILRNRKWLILSPLSPSDQSIIMVHAETSQLTIGDKILTIKTIDSKEVSHGENKGVAFLSAQELSFPLMVRKWKAGDYFYPLGMQKKKKLARFFIDQKLSLGEKENVWVVESAKKIAWVINHRIDDRFKIKPTTEKVVRLSWSSL